MKTAIPRSLLVLAACLALTQDVLAGDRSPSPLAATKQLPPALAALEPDAGQIISEREAGQIRGEWILSLSLPLVAARIEGSGPFQLDLLTLSGGVYAGNPVFVQIRIGR
jgi:hypothetical protein